MCIVLLQPGVNPIAVNKYGNININFHLVQKHPNRLRESPSLLFNWYPVSFPGVQRLGRDVDFLHLSRTEVKNKQSYTCTSTPSIRLHGVDKDSFKCFLNSYVTFCYIKQVGSRISSRMYAGNSRFQTRPERCAAIHCSPQSLKAYSVYST